MNTCICFGQNAVDQNSPEYAGWPGLLAGCVPDARDLCVAFAQAGYTARGMFSGWNVGGPANPWVMTLDCTRDAWRQAHTDLQAQAMAGDTIILADSGHGGTYPTAFGQGETLCFADGQLRDTELRQLMAGWPVGVRVVYIFDSCHSGGMDRDRTYYAPKCAPDWVTRRAVAYRTEAKAAPIAAMVIELCACRAGETAADGPHNGAFTGSLLHTLRSDMTWGQWFTATQKYMAGQFNQHPVLNILGEGEPMLLTQVKPK